MPILNLGVRILIMIFEVPMSRTDKKSQTWSETLKISYSRRNVGVGSSGMDRGSFGLGSSGMDGGSVGINWGPM